MLAFYAVRGYTPDTLANLSLREKGFLHYAMEKCYKETAEMYKAMFGA